MGKLVILDKTGDSEVQWRVGDTAATKAAMDRFNELIKQGHVAYRKEDNGSATQLKSFDREATEILVTPQLQGG